MGKSVKDIFVDYLKNKETNINIKKALTDKSYKSGNKGFNNKRLATYGDAIIKLCYLDILLDDEVEDLSVKKSTLESDENLVKYVAKKYKLLGYIDFDNTNNIHNYNYVPGGKTSGKNKKVSKYKFIATTVEAMVAAIYIEDKDLNKIKTLLKNWKKWIEDGIK